MKILLIDNYDSFTFNVYQYLLELGNDVITYRNDEITIEEIKELDPQVIFISPGPKSPSEAGICIEVIKNFKGKKPIFGVCLGHQAIGEAFGGKIIHAKSLFHGKTSKISTFDKGVMSNFKEGFIATRYHSLIIERETMPDCLEITCETEDGQIMGVKHKEYNIEGVQFHPESIMTEYGREMFKAFLDRCKKEQGVQEEVSKIKVEKSFKKAAVKFENIQTKEVKQYAKKVTTAKNMFDIFKLIQNSNGEENSTMLESVTGPKADCNSTYIGVNPQFELIIKDFKMYIKSKKNGIKEAFVNNLQSIYNKEKDYFDLTGIKFSHIFKVITSMFILNKKHEEEAAINNGLVGYFGYEYLHSLEKIQRTNKDVLNLPDVHLKYFLTIVQRAVDSSEVLVINNCLDEEDTKYLDEIIKVIGEGTVNEETSTKVNEEEINYAYNMTREDFLAKVDVAKKYILDGDIFQVQIGRRMHVKKNINPIKLYEKLREINPSPYMFYWNSGDYNLISNSPELQLKVENDDVLIRPIAGTSKGKGSNEAERNYLRDELVNNEKEQAEHIMLVDLARNDIGTVAVKNTVNVSKLMVVEEFSNVFHLVSSVEGRISKEVNTMELFENTFPAGTLTGAPKVRAMEIIEELEDEVRGPYGGAFGLFDFNGNIISSIIIRTVLRKGEDLYLQASAGIVADSISENECNEIEHKTNALKIALKGLV